MLQAVASRVAMLTAGCVAMRTRALYKAGQRPCAMLAPCVFKETALLLLNEVTFNGSQALRCDWESAFQRSLHGCNWQHWQAAWHSTMQRASGCWSGVLSRTAYPARQRSR